MVFKMHLCPEMDPEVAGFGKNHGYTRKELPLNVVTKIDHKGNSTTRNEFCPYCKEATKDMESLPGADEVLLGTNIRARGSTNRPEATMKAENTLLKQQLRAAVREELAAQKGKKGGND